MEKRLFELTCSEFIELLRQSGFGANAVPQKNLIVGLSAAAKELKVSLVTLHKWKRSGLLDGCYKQYGRWIEIDLDKVREAISKHKHP